MPLPSRGTHAFDSGQGDAPRAGVKENHDTSSICSASALDDEGASQGHGEIDANTLVALRNGSTAGPTSRRGADGCWDKARQSPKGGFPTDCERATDWRGLLRSLC